MEGLSFKFNSVLLTQVKWCARGLGFLIVLKTLSLATLFFLYKHNVYKHTKAEKPVKVKHMLSIIQAWDLI